MSFADKSKAAVKEFIRTVVVIDDRAFGAMPELELPVNVDLNAFAVGTQDIQVRDQEDTVPELDGDPESLDSKELVRSFAKHRLLCTIIKPSEVQGFEEDVLEAAKLADVVILDWDLNGDGGTAATEYARALVAGGSAQGLRVIVVYTGNAEDGIARAADSLFADIGGHDAGFDRIGQFTIQQGRRCRICFFGKTDFSGSRKVSLAELPETIISEFSSLSSGFLSNAVLRCLGQVRRQTPKLLSKFPEDIDDAYLLHRALLPTPAEAEDHVLPLIVDEIRAIVDTADWRAELTIDALMDYIRDAEKIDRFKQLFDPRDEAMLKLALTESASKKAFRDLQPNAKIKKFTKASEIVKLDQHETSFGTTEQDIKFAQLLNFESSYGPVTHLRLGTIVSVNDSFYICLQQLCDSVRLSHPTRFPFLPLLAREPGQSFFCVVETQEGQTRLDLPDLKLSSVLLFDFPVNNEKHLVLPTFEEGSCYFQESTERGLKFKFVAQLRFEQAQRIVGNLASNTARIGVTESEWQRLQSK